jgi:hypothetical protein
MLLFSHRRAARRIAGHVSHGRMMTGGCIGLVPLVSAGVSELLRAERAISATILRVGEHGDGPPCLAAAVKRL